MLESKDLLGLKDLSVEDIEEILDTTSTMKYIITTKNKNAPHLQGRSVINLFYENSTRTRVSFELASKYLSASGSNISVSTSSVQKGESLVDTGSTIDSMAADVIVVRHPLAGAPNLLAKNVKASVINAGDGMNEHPTQALLDIYTIKEKKGKIKGLKIAIIGDILHSRVARSNIWGLTKLGAEVMVAGPSTLIPRDIEKMGIKVFNSAQEALIDADVVMGLRMQLERQKTGFFPTMREYSRFFGLDLKRLRLSKDDVIVMHPGPVNRGIELSSAVIDSDKSVISEQVNNGVAVRMAILYLLTRRDKLETTN
ncbi:MAG: aspartate carbamoyltransferase catalytic subunit [Clostridiales bacterium]